MEESKISAVEIQNLRELAEKERQTRRLMQEYIELAKQKGLSAEQQMELVQRGKKDEILALLQAYAGDDAKEKMSAAAQLYLYEKDIIEGTRDVLHFLLRKVPYTDELAKRVIDDKLFCTSGDRFAFVQELSPDMQCYFLKHKLFCESSQTTNVFSHTPPALESIAWYFKKYDLCEKAEVYLIEGCLNPKPSSDSDMDVHHKLVRKYIFCKRKLSLAGERALIASGVHKLILVYIETAEKGLKAEDELLARGNREEVTAYFKRYATL